jgi:hypothetical protein
VGFGDLADALVGADVPVDVEHRQKVGVGRLQTGYMGGGHRGQQLVGPPGSGQVGDLAADRLDLRSPVQPQHPAQRDRVDPGGALGAELTDQGPQHSFDQHRVQAVEPVTQTPENRGDTKQQPGATEALGAFAAGSTSWTR